MIYFFGLLVGCEIGGVDYAQGERAKLFRRLGVNQRYIYSELPGSRELKLYENLGINRKEMLCVEASIAGHQSLECKVVLDDILPLLEGRLGYDTIETPFLNIVVLKRGGVRVATIELTLDGKYVLKINYYCDNSLITTEWYLGTHYCTDIFSYDEVNNPILSRRIFMSPNGNKVYEKIYSSSEKKYVFQDGKKYRKEELYEIFFEINSIGEKDFIIIDRPSFMDYCQAILQKAKAKKIVVFHSGHFFEKYESTAALNVNFEYYGYYKNANAVDCFVVSTDEQRDDFVEKLEKYGVGEAKVETIPVYSISCTKRDNEVRKRRSIVTASRLALGKRIDWLIRAVVEAHKKNEDITLDIFGEGAEYDALSNLIYELNANDYISLKGHQNIDDLLCEYELYASASTSETFGITLLQAVQSGNAVIGLDTRYGNHIFIKEEENGHLIDVDLELVGDEKYFDFLIQRYANAILDIFSSEEKLEQYRNKSYEIAEKYLDSKIEEKWISLMESI